MKRPITRAMKASRNLTAFPAIMDHLKEHRVRQRKMQQTGRKA
ncbi:MAG: hypothetical protein A4E61_00127 [Syntrophorhabdus sp. PtaB.Bin184]|nr:MAG: hypothetical protein A4E61_00127 [Syntrophorhabdus sp. PtaB.Bin184]